MRSPLVPRRDIVAAGVALVLIVPSVLIAHDHKVGDLEAKVFRGINGLPEGLKPLMNATQFLGVLIVPLIFAVIALAFRKWRLAIALVLVMPLKLFVEKQVLKELVQRQRPGTSIGDDAILRGDVSAHGNSFPSGHAMIAFAIAWLLFPYLPRPWRWVGIGIGVLVCFARVYLGAHNPLDVVAGAGAGLLIGAFLDALISRPDVAEHETAPIQG